MSSLQPEEKHAFGRDYSYQCIIDGTLRILPRGTSSVVGKFCCISVRAQFEHFSYLSTGSRKVKIG